MDTPAPRRSQAERRASTRALLVEAALGAVAALGYERATLSEVTARSGLSNGALYLHFPTKATLMAEVAVLCGERLTAPPRAVDRTLSADAQLRRVIKQLWSRTQDPAFQVLIDLIRASRAEVELQAALRDNDARAAQVFFDVLASVVDADSPDFRRKARLFGLALYGTALTADLRTPLARRRLLADMQLLAVSLFTPAHAEALG